MISFNTQKEQTPLVLESKKSKKNTSKTNWMSFAMGAVTALAIVCVVFYLSADSKTATLNTDLQGASATTTAAPATTPAATTTAAPATTDAPAADDSADDGPEDEATKDDAAATTDAKADAGTAVEAGAAAKDSTSSTALKDCAWYEKAWDTFKSWFGSDEECS